MGYEDKIRSYKVSRALNKNRNNDIDIFPSLDQGANLV